MDAAFAKETLRCSDYRKGIILVYKALVDCEADKTLIMIFQTAVELSDILYARPEERNATNILRLHNISFIHGMLCIQVFGQPQKMTSRKFFGRYFHSLTSHAAVTYRLISLRSVNTETQERMFQTAKGITRSTSNRHADHIVIQRVQEEQTCNIKSNCLDRQESEITQLSNTCLNKSNTKFSKDWIKKYSTHYQAHLERISDYLLHGQGALWDETTDEIEFYDTLPCRAPASPEIHHFRSTNSTQIYEHLLECWQKCCDEKIKLPASTIRQYTSSGELSTIINM